MSLKSINEAFDRQFNEISAHINKKSKVKNKAMSEAKHGKPICEGWRGTPVKIISHGSWSDPDLVWKGYTFNYWDIEDAMWSMFLEETGHKDSESNNPKVEKEFDKYVQDNYKEYLEDVIYGGYFEDGSKSWHDRYKRESCGKRRKKSRKINEESEFETKEIFHNDNGKDYEIVERSKSGTNALLKRKTLHGEQWIVAWNCPKNNRGSWGQGHYFFDEDSARELWRRKYLKESILKKNKKVLKESNKRRFKNLNESFDDMRVFMNTWANYNEYGADSGITPTGWMSIDDALDYCEEYADYEPFINDTDNVPFDNINEYSSAYATLEELKELQESDVDEDVVSAIVEATGYDIKEAVEIAESGDYYWYPGLSSYTDLAYAFIDEIGSLKDALGDRVVNYIDEDQMRREYRWDVRDMMRDYAEEEVDREHYGEDEDSYDREQEIEDWIDEHEDDYLESIIDEDIRLAEAGEIDLSNYFDYEAFGRDLSFDGYTIVSNGIILVM